jgi:hypothetical protein
MRLFLFLLLAAMTTNLGAQSPQTGKPQSAGTGSANQGAASAPKQTQTAADGAAKPTQTGAEGNTKKQQVETGGTTADAQTSSQYENLDKKVDALTNALKKQDQQTDFALVLGIGSLIDSSAATDYTDDNNILSASSLGTASPQYLVGVSFRVPVQAFTPFAGGQTWDSCYPSSVGNKRNNERAQKKKKVKQQSSSTSSEEASSGKSSTKTPTGESSGTDDKGGYCDVWKLHPWAAFLSLKFASSSSQTLSGYVLGGSYQFAKYLSGLIGYGFTPFNEPGKGLRTTAYQYVTEQQKMGNLLNFNANGMLTGGKNAFDGFSLLDANGKLIYTGKPLEIHYRGGVVFGVSVPLSFGSIFSQKPAQ